MAVTIKEVEKVAKLARLTFTESEKEKMISEMNQMLTYFEKIAELDTDNVPATSHIASTKNVMREDVISPSYDRELLFKSAPDTEKGYFRVPRVIKDRKSSK